jgi:hypothetical protein
MWPNDALKFVPSNIGIPSITCQSHEPPQDSSFVMLLLPKLTMSMHTWRKKEKEEKEKKKLHLARPNLSIIFLLWCVFK